MATGGERPVDPGGGVHQEQTSSYADRLKRNVLEITLEKREKDADIFLDQDSVARLLKSIGMDVQTQMEGYQIQFNGRTSIVSVWAAKGLNLERFCKAEAINVTKGVMTGMIRPSGRKDVTVTVSGLDFNTPDSLVFEYIKRFGGIIISNNVIYTKFSEGPFKGKCNGERKYQVDFTESSRSMGTYHFLDGTKIFYRGNEKTCGRCHRTSRTCLGGGIAKECDQAGGGRMHLNDHMRKIWSEIGFVPSSFELPTNEEFDGENDQPVAEAEKFPRADTKSSYSETDKERFIGISIANFSLDLTDEEIESFVVEKIGDEVKNKIDIIREKKKAVATINHSLSADKIKETIDKLSFNECKLKFFGRPLYCRPIRDITPIKNTPVEKTSGSQLSPTGIMEKKIPGLPPSAQAKAISRKRERERKERKEKEKKLKEATNEGALEVEMQRSQKIAQNKSAFEVLMNAQKSKLLDFDPRDRCIPPDCSPAPLTSIFGKQIDLETKRRMSLGSSPCLNLKLKRGAQELSSPTSPSTAELKKSKSEDENRESVSIQAQ